jgi:hypothetical protein
MQIAVCISQLENSCRRAERKHRGLIVFEMAESPRRDDPQLNAGSGSYLSIAIRHRTSG